MFIAQSARECAEFVPRVFELPKELQRRLRQAGELKGAELDEETLAQHRRAYLDQSPRHVLDVVNDPALDRLVILGDPGSGKSTLLQYLLLKWAEKAAPDLPQDPLPLLIELREYARLRHEGNATSFLEYLHQGASVRWHFDQGRLDSWLKANPSIVLFDGLDKVFDATLRKEVTTAIHRFADEYRPPVSLSHRGSSATSIRRVGGRTNRGFPWSLACAKIFICQLVDRERLIRLKTLPDFQATKYSRKVRWTKA